VVPPLGAWSPILAPPIGPIGNRKLGLHKIEEVLATGTLQRETHPLRR